MIMGYISKEKFKQLQIFKTKGSHLIKSGLVICGIDAGVHVSFHPT